MRVIGRFLRVRLVKDIGRLTFGAGFSQIALLVATPAILRLYGAEQFGIYATVIGAAAVLGGITSLRLDIIIPYADSRYRALRLVAATIAILSISIIIEYVLLGSTSALLGQWLELHTGAAFHYAWWVPAVAFGQTVFVSFRVWLIRCTEFKEATLGQVTRVSIFISCAICFGLVLPQREAVYGILVAQILGDWSGITFFVCRLRASARRLVLPLPPSRAINELRHNRKFLSTVTFTSILALINQNIPIWTIGYAFGMQPAGWFSAAQRVVSTPIQFTIDTIGAAVTQRLRTKRSRGQPINGDIFRLVGALCLLLSPIFLSLEWLAHSGYLAILGAGWAGAGPTLAAMLLISFGSVFYSAVGTLPLLLRLDYVLIAYHCTRFIFTGLISLIALANTIGYGSWIYLFAISEMVLYAGNATSVLVYVHRTERKNRLTEPALN